MSKKIKILSTDNKTIEALQFPNMETEVLAVETGLEALLNTDADVLVIDESNPFSLSTVDISKIIRTKNTEVVIIILAADNLAATKIANLEAGADDYLTKPADITEIQARLKAIFRRFPDEAQAVATGSDHQFNDLQLDIKRRMCFIRNQEITLTQNEFATLFRLVQNQGKVVTREFLLKEVWETEDYGNSRPVDGVIRRLRKKLKEQQSDTEIKLLWGHGYRVEAQ